MRRPYRSGAGSPVSRLSLRIVSLVDRIRIMIALNRLDAPGWLGPAVRNFGFGPLASGPARQKHPIVANDRSV